MSNIFTIHAISKKIKEYLSFEKLAPIWRFILVLFSADYFLKFKWSWIQDWDDLGKVNDRTLSLLSYIAICIALYFIIYTVFKWPLRLIFHGYVKSRVLEGKKELEKKNVMEKSRSFIELYSRVSSFFQRYLFKYGLISSNDLSTPINYDFKVKEEEFNDAMNSMYKWLLMLLHTTLLSIVVWEFYAWWFFLIMIMILSVSLIVTFGFSVLILNMEVLEILRIKLLKENKKHWK